MVLRPTLDQQVTFLYTADLEQTAAFYRDVLQLPLALDQGACRIFGVTRQAFVGFCQHLEAPAQPQGVILTLVSEQVDAWHDFLRAQGAAIEKPPTHNARFNIYHLFLRDPNGYLIEIQQFLDPAWPSVRRGHDI
jgi:catechol 2,3-dioxygenase-like lactoylglutathione lyase family enzyme